MQCNIEILDQTEYCPLCGSVLEKTQEGENAYPDIHIKAKSMTLLLRIFSFSAIAIEMILVTIAYFSRLSWLTALIPALILFYAYMALRFAVDGKSGHRVKIMVLAILAVLTLVALDHLIGYNGWSVNYVFPAAILIVDIGILVLLFVNKQNWQSYIMQELIVTLIGGVGLVLCKIHIVTVPVTIVIAFEFSLLLLIGTIVIGGRRARTEIKRRFHIR